uniref:Putative secreted protein n=1 Tax=Anopheles marajoara TaxID=58244 RepID=A0A2M4CAZ8_9DIPT
MRYSMCVVAAVADAADADSMVRYYGTHTRKGSYAMSKLPPTPLGYVVAFGELTRELYSAMATRCGHQHTPTHSTDWETLRSRGGGL